MAAAEAAGSSCAPAQQQQQQQQTLVIRSPLDRKQDVFDAADFDPTKFINQIYPDGRLGRVCRHRPPVLDARAPPCNCCVVATAQRRRWETLTGSSACSRSRYAGAWLCSSTTAQAQEAWPGAQQHRCACECCCCVSLPANTTNRSRPSTRRFSQPSGRRATHRHAQGERGLVLQELAAAGSLHAAACLAHPCCTCLPVRVHPCRQDLSDATAQMSELFKRVKDIQQKAADSEVLVQEICRDIRKVRRNNNPASCANFLGLCARQRSRMEQGVAGSHGYAQPAAAQDAQRWRACMSAHSQSVS